MIQFRRSIPVIPAAFALVAAAAAQTAAPAAAQTAAPAKDAELKGFPFQDEALHYTINWSSGLSLGEARLTARHTANGWDFEVTLDAAVPGFAVRDKFTSSATTSLCSAVLSRDISHGSKKVKEKTTFDQEKGTAHRVTEYPADGGSSDVSTPACARDAIAYVYFGRKELGQGRVPPAQQVFFGSAYAVRMEYTGAQSITVGDKKEVTDHLVVSEKGPKSDFSVEVFYARDAARTPLLVKIPQAAGGTLTMELVR
jgi:hypothetical protein